MAVILSSEGSFPAEAERLAEIIQDYDPTLELRWIPPAIRTNFDNKPFSIWHCPPGLPEYMVMSLRETELDHRVLASLFNANNNNGSVLDKLEAEEKALEIMRLKRQMDQQEADREFAVWALRQTRTVRHNGVVYT